MRLPTEHPTVDAVLRTAASLLHMEVVFLGGLTDETFTFEKVVAAFASSIAFWRLFK